MVIGGIVNKFQTNAISGKGEVIVVEADEFDRTFLSLQPTMSVITNLDLEHLDCYENLDDLRGAFIQFANAAPFYGLIASCIDSENVRTIIPYIKRPLVTYGFSEDADYQATKVSFNESYSSFDVIAFGKSLGKIKLNIPGRHNILNALGAIIMALELDIEFSQIQMGVESYTGVRRRFEIKHKTQNNVLIVDDYAHHPSEVSATLDAAKSGWNRRIISIFQPHLFSRTRDFYKDFAAAFLKTDVLVITDIFHAREEPISGVSSELIINELKTLGFSKIISIPNANDILNNIASIIKDDDMIITMGAGSIWRHVKKFMR